MKIFHVILVLMLLPYKPLAQTIRGKVGGRNGEIIPYAKIIVKDSLSAISIREFLIVRNGAYQLTLREKYQHLVLQISANNYLVEHILLKNPGANQEYVHDFLLWKDTIIKLADVVVKAKQRPVHVRGDTVTYNVAGYANGTERKIQDVIKKMPGMQVDEKTGEIKYKGQSVETVKLDGDDLFGSNYMIGTKNINVDMVEQVQALENYVENALLKGLDGREKVALNLVLKKNKTDFSGSIDLGLGIKAGKGSAIDASADVLGIASKYKSFATVSYNNIGINNTPFDYFSYSPAVEQLRSAGFTAKKYLGETFFNSELEASRRNINHSFFGSYNAVFKIGKKVNVKANLFVINDLIESKQFYATSNSLGNAQFFTSDRFSLQKRPMQLRGDVELKVRTSQRSGLEYKVSLKQEKIATNSDVLQNDSIHYDTELKSRDAYLKQAMLFTRRLSDNKALQLSVNQSSNAVPQDYYFNPAVYDSGFYSLSHQYSGVVKNYSDVAALLVGKSGKDKYFFSIGASNNGNDVNTHLAGLKDNRATNIEPFNNDIFYRTRSVYTAGNWKFTMKRWKFTPSYKVGYVQQELEDHISPGTTNSGKVTFDQGMSVTYRLNSFSILAGSFNYSQKPLAENYLFSNPIFTNNRTIQLNVISLELQNTNALSLFYMSNNLGKQSQVNVGVSMFTNKGNYFSNLMVEPTIIRSLSFYLPLSNQLINANFMAEKYLPFLSGTIRVKSNYSLSGYKNVVNQSDLRNNSHTSFNAELFFKTALDIKVNFENTARFNTARSSGDGTPVFTNHAWSNNFQVIVKPHQDLFFLLSTDYYLPDTRISRSYLFADASLHYSPANKKYSWNLAVKNLLNHTYFTQVQTNDYSTTSSESNLLSRYCMLSFSRNF